MPCGGTTPSELFANPREAYLLLADVVMGRSQERDIRIKTAALNDVQLAVNENENLREEVKEMARIIADLNKQLEAKAQAVFA